MTALAALRAARAAGINIALDRDNLVLEAAREPAGAIVDGIKQNKDEIVALLRTGNDVWSIADWQAFFDQRKAIAISVGGLPLGQAEAGAFSCCVSEWLNRHPQTSSPGQCLACQGDESSDDRLLPFGTDLHGHAWLHSRCWRGWHECRRQQAVAGLVAMGIDPPAKFQDDFGKNGGQ